MKKILNFLLGPSIRFNKRKNGKFSIDILPIIAILLAVISFVALLLIRGKYATKDVLNYFVNFVFSFNFTNPIILIFYITFIVVLGLSVLGAVFNQKKHVTSILAIVSPISLVLLGFFINYMALVINITPENIGTFIVMEIPQILLAIVLLVLSYRLIHKLIFVRKTTSPYKDEYFEQQTDLLINFLKFTLSFFKNIGLGILNFFKNIGKKMGGFFKAFAKSYIHNTYQFKNKKDQSKDKTIIAAIIAFVFAFSFFFIIQGGDESWAIIGEFILSVFSFNSSLSTLLFVMFVITLAIATFSIIYLRLNHCESVLDTLTFVLFMFVTIAMIYVTSIFGINKDNAFIYVIMEIPTWILLVILTIRSTRMFVKIIKVRNNEERINDYAYRMTLVKKLPRKFAKYMAKNWGQVLVIIALIALALAVLYPLLILLMRSFKFSTDDLMDPFGVPDRTTFENYKLMWNMLKDAYINSLVTTISVTVGTLILSSFAAFAFIRFRFPAKNVIFYAIVGLMMIPGILTLISRFQLVNDMGLVGSLWGIILPGIAGFTPMAFMLLFTFFKGVPKDLFEAADIDGANDFGIFMNVVTPLSKPILFTIAIQTFVGEWNDYLWAYLIVGSVEEKNTLPVLLQSISTTYQNGYLGMSVPFAGYVLSAIPLILIFIVASKQFIEGLTSGAFKM